MGFFESSRTANSSIVWCSSLVTDTEHQRQWQRFEFEAMGWSPDSWMTHVRGSRPNCGSPVAVVDEPLVEPAQFVPTKSFRNFVVSLSFKLITI